MVVYVIHHLSSGEEALVDKSKSLCWNVKMDYKYIYKYAYLRRNVSACLKIFQVYFKCIYFYLRGERKVLQIASLWRQGLPFQTEPNNITMYMLALGLACLIILDICPILARNMNIGFYEASSKSPILTLKYCYCIQSYWENHNWHYFTQVGFVQTKKYMFKFLNM